MIMMGFYCVECRSERVEFCSKHPQVCLLRIEVEETEVGKRRFIELPTIDPDLERQLRNELGITS